MVRSRGATLCRPLLGLALAATFLAPLGPAQGAGPALDQFIQAQMTAGHVPGLSACIVKGQAVVWRKGYGLANVATGQPVTPDTLFMLASVSKTITGTALMQLWEEGRFDLDADVSNLLPYQVVDPNFPRLPLTPRHLLTHTSGLKDNWAFMPYTHGDAQTPLDWFCEQYITPGGLFWDAQKNWSADAPGSAYRYSNFGFAMVGNLAQQVGGRDFEELCQARIFQPLGMTESSFRLAKLDPTHIAHPYSWSGGGWVDHGFYGYPDYPDGCLRTSVTQLAAFLGAHMNDGTWSGVPLLAPRTARMMRSVQFPAASKDQGLAFYWAIDGATGVRRVGHQGGDQGVMTEMWYYPADGVGVIVLANGDGGPAAITAIVDRLYREALLL